MSLFAAALLEEIRERFSHVESDPDSGQRVYFENAGGTLTLKRVLTVLAEQTALPDNAGRNNPTSRRIDDTIARGRSDLLALFGAESGTVTLGQSTTANAFRTLGTIVREVAGDNVVTTDLDHPATYDATRILAERHGKERRVAELSPRHGRVDPGAVVRCVDADTVVLAMIHSSNITGSRNDVATIIREARTVNPGLYVLVDGAQYGSHGPIDFHELGCDVYLLSSYKFFSKIGASAAYLSDRVARLPHDQLLGKPKEEWDMGTREQGGFAAWSAVVDYLSWLGGHFTDAEALRPRIKAAMTAVELHERGLTERMLRGGDGVIGLLDMDHVTVYCKTGDPASTEACIIFNVGTTSAEEVVSYLEQKGIRAHSRVSDAYSCHTLRALDIRECVRVSMAHYNTPSDVDAFLRAIADCRGARDSSAERDR